MRTAVAAGVSRRWLSDLEEAGKPTAEVGLVLKLLDALRLTLSIEPAAAPRPGEVDLDELLRDLGGST